MPPILRIILGVMAGFLTINCIVIVLTLISVKAMHLQSGHPTPGYLVANVAYSFAAALAGGFVAAFFARPRAITAASVLAAIMLFFGIFSYLHYTGQQPLWYQILMIVAMPVAALVGAALYARRFPANV